MKKNLILWMGPVRGGVFPKFDGTKSEAYHEFFVKANERFNFYLAFELSAHTGDGSFKDLAVYKKGEVVGVGEEQVQADVIYYYSNVVGEGELDAGNARVINSVDFKRFGADKYKQYQYLEEFFPKTEKLDTVQGVEQYISNFKESDTIVLKPCRASCGDGVVVAFAKDIQVNQLDIKKLDKNGYIGQDFLDTSAGISNVTGGTHDLRIMTMVDKIVLCHVRNPEEGSLVGNTHKGAAMKEIFFEDLPEEVQDFYHKVHKKIKSKYPEPLYSMDLGLTPSGPFLFEINAHTAFPRKDFSVFESFLETLINVLDS